MIFLYRKNGGRVVGASMDDDAYSDVDVRFFSAVSNPPTPDGTSLKDKVFDGISVRRATSQEIGAFRSAEEADKKILDRDRAKAVLNNDIQRKLFNSMIDSFLSELNAMRSRLSMPPKTRGDILSDIRARIDTED